MVVNKTEVQENTSAAGNIRATLDLQMALAKPISNSKGKQPLKTQESGQYSSAREHNIRWRVWHLRKLDKVRAVTAEEILRNSPKLWETKMQMLTAERLQGLADRKVTTSQRDNKYFRRIRPKKSSVTEPSELRKALSTLRNSPEEAAPKEAVADQGQEKQQKLRMDFTRFHNQNTVANRVAYLGEDSSVRGGSYNLAALAAKRERLRKAKVTFKADYEEKSERNIASIPCQKASSFLFPMPKDGHVYSNNPVSGWLLPFALSCLPEGSFKEFSSTAQSNSIAGYMKVRHSGSSRWTTRWFQTRYHHLFEFEEEDSTQPIGVISLLDAVIALTNDEKCVELSIHECKITGNLGVDTPVGTSAPTHDYSLPRKMKGSHASYLNKLPLASPHARKVINLAPDDDGATVESIKSLYRSLSTAKSTRLDDLYRIGTKSMGQGRFAHVLPAQRRKDGQKCAVKVIRKREFWGLVEAGKERTDTVSREVATQLYLSRLACQSDGVVSLLDVFETRELLVLELELMETDLFQVMLKRKKLSEDSTRQIMKHLINTIGHLQSVKIAHRDIKLSNIVFPTVPKNGHQSYPKLADFGMAAFVGTDGRLTGRCGTPGYVAPEILYTKPKESYGNGVDLFSLGVVGYTLLCGYEPFYGKDEKELIASNKYCLPAFEGDAWSGISSDAKAFIAGLLKRNPKDRLSVIEALNMPWLSGTLSVKTKTHTNDGRKQKGSDARAAQVKENTCTIS